MSNNNSINTKNIENDKSNTRSGALSDVDIEDYINKKQIFIHPFTVKKLTPLGYNLSFTKFIYSINDKMLLEILERDSRLFCSVKPHDTVLIISLESVWLSKNMIGTFYSKVGIVSKGFGHISTTLDPGWEGPLLFSLNNPTNQTLELEIGEEKDGEVNYNTFVTLIFEKLMSTSKIEHDNKPVRIDILKSIKDSLGNKKCEKEFKDILNKFQSIQIKRIGLSPEMDEQILNRFKNKYDDLNVEIGKCIQQVEKIRNKQNTSNIIKKTIFWILSCTVLVTIAYIGTCSYKNGNDSLLALLALLLSAIFFVCDKVYNYLYKG